MIEYVALVALVAGIVAAMNLAGVADTIAAEARNAICRIVGGECEEPPNETEPPEQDQGPVVCDGPLSIEPPFGTSPNCRVPDDGGKTTQRSTVPVPEDGFAGEVWKQHCDEAMGGQKEMPLDVSFEWEDLGDGRMRITGMTVTNHSKAPLYLDQIFLGATREGGSGETLGEIYGPAAYIEPGDTQPIKSMMPAPDIFPVELDMNEADLFWNLNAWPAEAKSYPGAENWEHPCGLTHSGHVSG